MFIPGWPFLATFTYAQSWGHLANGVTYKKLRQDQ